MVQLSSVVSTFLALSAAIVTASPLGQKSQAARAAYFQTNKSPNNVVAVKLESNGKVGDATWHPTRGDGSAELTPTGPHVPDSLGSANCVVVFGDYLFVANAGSNHVTLFYIPPENPTDLELIGNYLVNGNFPNSIAVKDNLVCVAYDGVRSGVSCASWGPRGIGAFDSLRPFDLHQQNKPDTTLLLVSDVLFAKDDSILVVTVRGSATAPGFVATYPTERNGQVSAKASDIAPAGIISAFGAVAIPRSSEIFVSDPSFGGFVLDVDHPQTPVSKTTVPGQGAICWVGITTDASSGILPDAGNNVLTQVNLKSGKILQQWNSTNGNSGNFDFSISGDDKLFALAFNPADSLARVASFDVDGKFKDLDNVPIANTDNFAQGLATYPVDHAHEKI